MTPEAIQSLTDKFMAGFPHGAAPRAPARTWAPDDLWCLTPPEFKGATLSAGILAILNGKTPPTSLAIIGSPGTGKTRLLWAMNHSLLKGVMRTHMGEAVSDDRYLSDREIPRCIERAITNASRMRIITEVGDIRAHRYDRAPLNEWAKYPHWLAVDDVGCIEPNEWVREAIYHLSNERRSRGLPTVWTSNLTRQQFRDTFGGAIASRVLGGEVVEVEGADRRVS
jgi:DNA replication protein DnaC